jgi:hypothetical protein
MRLRATLVLVALAACAAIVAAPAAGKGLTTPTTIGPLLIIKDNPTQYLVSGKVVAKTAGCRSQRTVALHVQHPGSVDTIVASTKTNAGPGLFSFRVALTPSDSVFVATPPKKFVTKSGKRVRCLAGQSIPQRPT